MNQPEDFEELTGTARCRVPGCRWTYPVGAARRMFNRHICPWDAPHAGIDRNLYRP